ncbi:MAG: hypothetical protein JW751_24555, partial [Polyangiaceae bacterium]|nr:hypothetical protein [Polyangiaceae bacterium]
RIARTGVSPTRWRSAMAGRRTGSGHGWGFSASFLTSFSPVLALRHHTARAEWIRFSATRIHAALHLPPRDRADMVRFLARRALPVE